MATLTIDSKLRLNSGYEIPVLGYGVSPPIYQFVLKMKLIQHPQVYQTYARDIQLVFKD
jgi:hypothetical protein